MCIYTTHRHRDTHTQPQTHTDMHNHRANKQMTNDEKPNNTKELLFAKDRTVWTPKPTTVTTEAKVLKLQVQKKTEKGNPNNYSQRIVNNQLIILETENKNKLEPSAFHERLHFSIVIEYLIG